MSRIEIFKGMRNFECLFQGAYDEMIEILAMIDKAEQSNKWYVLSETLVEDPDEAFEKVNEFLLKLKSELLNQDFECTEQEIVQYLIRRKLGKI